VFCLVCGQSVTSATRARVAGVIAPVRPGANPVAPQAQAYQVDSIDA
jgi:hypothetical protein